MALNLAIFGLTVSSSWGNGHATPYRALLRGLRHRGHRMTFYEKDVEYYACRRDFTACDFCDLVLYRDWRDIRSRALSSLRHADAAIVASYCPEGALIADEVLALSGPLHVFYDLDTPITLAQLAAGDLDYLRRDQISRFHLYLSFTGGRILAELEKTYGARRARPLYGCVDADSYTRAPVRDAYRCLLSYMGTYASDRQQRVDQLFLEPSRRMPDRQFVLAGTLYPHHWQWGTNVRRFDHVPPAEHPAFYSSSRATLNITREAMARWGYCPSGRFFEAAACGTALLSDRWEGLETFFFDGEEIFLVDNADQVLSVLERSDAELSRAAACARQRTLDEHTGDRRAGQLLAYLEEARVARPPSAAQDSANRFSEVAA